MGKRMEPRNGMHSHKSTEIHAGKRTREEEAMLYRTVLETSLDGFLLVDHDGHIIDVNDSYLGMSGYTREELSGMHIAPLDAREDAAAVTAQIERVEQTGSDTFETTHRRKDGGVFDVSVRTRFLDTEKGGYAVFVRDISEEKRAGKQLLESELKYRSLFESGSDAAFLVDEETLKLIDANRMAEVLYGYSREEFLALSAPDLSAEPAETAHSIRNSEHYPPVPHATGRHLRLGTHRKKDGTVFPVEITASRFRIGNRNLNISSVRDLSERRHAEEELRLLSFCVDHASVSVFQITPGGEFTYVNDAACRSLGRSRDELLGNTVGGLDPNYPDHARAAHWRKLKEHGTLTFETEHRHADGRAFPVEVTGHYVRYGEEEYEFAFATDITERKRAEAALVESRTRLSQVLDAVKLGTWDWHVQSGEAVYNELWARMKGYDASEIRPHISSQENLIHPDDLAGTRKRLADHLAGASDMYEAEFRMKHKSGGWIWVAEKGKVVERDSGGNALRVCGTQQDITETKQLNERLRQAERMEALGTLAGGIAHDFNNALGGIIGYADMTLDDVPAESRSANNLKRILQGGNRAKELVGQILSFSRGAPEGRTPQYVRPVIKEVVELLRAGLPSSIEIRSTLARDTKPVMADPTRIHEIVMNLCTNAAQAMKDEKGVLEILHEESTVEEEIVGRAGTVPPAVYSVITVRDNGSGMDEETLAHAFEPFYTTKAHGEGTGMGLAVLFGIVQSHGGTVTVESRLNQGTTFRVYLPKCRGEYREEVQSTAPPARGTERIMFVDDEKTMSDLAHEMLTDLGYAVTAFNDSTTALATFRRNPSAFDLLFTDQTMPGISGRELAAEIRRVRPELPIILCTGFSRQVDEKSALIEGIDGFIRKPFRKRDVADRIRSVLQRKDNS